MKLGLIASVVVVTATPLAAEISQREAAHGTLLGLLEAQGSISTTLIPAVATCLIDGMNNDQVLDLLDAEGAKAVALVMGPVLAMPAVDACLQALAE